MNDVTVRRAFHRHDKLPALETITKLAPWVFGTVAASSRLSLEILDTRRSQVRFAAESSAVWRCLLCRAPSASSQHLRMTIFSTSSAYKPLWGRSAFLSNQCSVAHRHPWRHICTEFLIPGSTEQWRVRRPRRTNASENGRVLEC